MPLWSGTPWSRGPARSSCAGWTTTANWSACRGRTGAISGMPVLLQPGRRAAGRGLRPERGRGRPAAGMAPGTPGAARQPAEPRRRSVPPRWPPPAVPCDGGGHRRLGPRSSAGSSGGCRWTSAPNRLALDPEGRRLAVNNTIRTKEIEWRRGSRSSSWKPAACWDWRSQVGNGDLAWSADGQLLAVGSDWDDPRVYVWNVRRGALASVLQGHTAAIVTAQFALGLPAGDLKLGWHDPALGRRLGGAPGDGAG